MRGPHAEQSDQRRQDPHLNWHLGREGRKHLEGESGKLEIEGKGNVAWDYYGMAIWEEGGARGCKTL